MVNPKATHARAGDRTPGSSKGRPAGNDALKSNVATISGLKNDVYLMGLDVSTIATGWAVMNGGGRLVKYGVIKPTGDVPARLQITRNELSVILNKYKPTLIAIEDMIAFRNGKVTKLLNYFSGVAYLTCFDFNGNDVLFFASSSLKKLIGVNPRALKKQGLKRDDIKELIYQKISDLFNFKIAPFDPDYKYRHDVADAVNCCYKLSQVLKEGKR